MSRRARCYACGKVVAVGVPGAGDGSVDVYRRHKQPDGTACEAGRETVESSDYVESDA